MRPTTRRLIGALVLSFGLTGVVTTSPAQAHENTPPVAVDDRVKLRFGQPQQFDVLANDSDPDGDRLEVCRLGEIPRGLIVHSDAEETDGGLLIMPKGRVRAGTFTFTYYACDFASLTPATVTVVVTKPPEIKVQRMDAHPGFLRVRNTAKFRIIFAFGDFRRGGPDGFVRLAGRDTKFVRVRRTRIHWVAFSPRFELPVDHGSVRNITLPPGTRPPAEQDGPEFKSSLRLAWRTAAH